MPLLMKIGDDVLITTGLIVFPFAVGWLAERLLHRRRSARNIPRKDQA